MRAVSLLFSTAVYSAGNAAAIALASARYSGAAQHRLTAALILTGISCVAAAFALRRTMPTAALFKRTIAYAALVLGAMGLIVSYKIGLDGILPMRDGTQNVGLGVLAANGDAFGLIVAASTLACRKFLTLNQRPALDRDAG